MRLRSREKKKKEKLAVTSPSPPSPLQRFVPLEELLSLPLSSTRQQCSTTAPQRRPRRCAWLCCRATCSSISSSIRERHHRQRRRLSMAPSPSPPAPLLRPTTTAAKTPPWSSTPSHFRRGLTLRDRGRCDGTNDGARRERENARKKTNGPCSHAHHHPIKTLPPF